MRFEPYRGIGPEERAAVNRVMEKGILSGFVSGPPDCRDAPNGGPEVKALEKEWAAKYNVKHAVAFNSATSGLLAACGACGIGPGDIVVCPPWTMSATIAAPKFYGAEIAFADIEEDYYCIDPEEVIKFPEFKAVIAVNLFGQPCDLERLKNICRVRGAYLIEDSAQAPFAWYDQMLAGTVGDIGVYSLNRHKHIHCGEGGIAVTNDDELARGLRSVRNHGIDPLGLNLRMTELEAAVARVQLKNIRAHINVRERLGKTLSGNLRRFMDVPKVRPGCTHNYYLWTAKFKGELSVPHIKGYIQPLNRIFADVECPVTERMCEEVVCFETCKYDIQDPSPIVEAFREAVR